MKMTFAGALLAAALALPAAAADLGGKVVNIGSDTTYPPHEFIEDGVVKGFDVDVVAAICERVKCQPNWITTAWDGFGVLDTQIDPGLPRVCAEEPCAGMDAGGGDCQLPEPYEPGDVCAD